MIERRKICSNFFIKLVLTPSFVRSFVRSSEQASERASKQASERGVCQDSTNERTLDDVLTLLLHTTYVMNLLYNNFPYLLLKFGLSHEGASPYFRLCSIIIALSKLFEERPIDGAELVSKRIVRTWLSRFFFYRVYEKRALVTTFVICR